MAILCFELQSQILPVDARALDAEQDAKVDAGPAGIGMTAVAAVFVPRQGLDSLQDALPSHAALPRFTGWVDATGGGRGGPVQMLQTETISLFIMSMFLCLLTVTDVD